MGHQPIKPPSSSAGSGRLLELDALRGLAALAVVLFHYTTRYDQLFGHAEAIAAHAPWGGFGVDLFFMLSGFVILMTLERTANSWKFAWGRFSRLYPTYWAAAALTFIVVAICGLPGQEVRFDQALVNVTMVQSLMKVPHIDGAYWSLQAELFFYVNMLLLYRLGAFRRPAATVVCWVAVAGGAYLLQSYTTTAWPLAASILNKIATIGSLRFIPLFGMGMLLYDAQRAGKYSNSCWLGFASCLVFIWYRDGVATLLIDLSLVALLWLAVSRRLPALAAAPLVWLGAISYSLYLTHQNIGYVVIRYLESHGVSPMIAISMAIALALFVGACLHYWVERPSMRALRKIDFSSITRKADVATAGS